MNGKQKGFTLVELLLAMAMTGVVSCAALGVIYNEYHGTASMKTTMTATHELTSADRWITQDAMMAESTNLVDGGQAENSLSLSWVDRYEFANVPHTCTYSLLDGQLIRDYDGETITVARNITDIEFSLDNNILEVSVFCTPLYWESRTTSKSFSVYLRTVSEASLQ